MRGMKGRMVPVGSCLERRTARSSGCLQRIQLIGEKRTALVSVSVGVEGRRSDRPTANGSASGAATAMVG